MASKTTLLQEVQAATNKLKMPTLNRIGRTLIYRRNAAPHLEFLSRGGRGSADVVSPISGGAEMTLIRAL